MSSAQTPEYKLLFKSIITSVSLNFSSNFPALRVAYTETGVTFLRLRQGLDPRHQLDPRPS